MLQRRSISVPVAGGELSIEVTGASPSDASRFVVFLHDLAANAVRWRLVTARLDPSITSCAIDARGRAASSALPEPFGMAAHVADVVAVLDHFSVASCVVVGHGTGALTASALASSRPDRVDGLVLVDGGLPIVVADDPREAIDALLLPLLQRLRTNHVDRAAALLDARRHMTSGIVESVAGESVAAESVLHDLGGRPPRIRRRTNEEAVWFDGSELLLDPGLSTAIEDVDCPVELLQVDATTSPVAIVDGVVPADASELERRRPNVRVVVIPGLDHEELLLHPQGADAVGRAVARVILRSGRPGP